MIRIRNFDQIMSVSQNQVHFRSKVHLEALSEKSKDYFCSCNSPLFSQIRPPLTSKKHRIEGVFELHLSLYINVHRPRFLRDFVTPLGGIWTVHYVSDWL